MSPDRILDFYLRCSGFEIQKVMVRGVLIRYLVRAPKNSRGSIVLVHGIGASAGHYWKVAGPLSRAGYTVYLPDLPSHGMSGNLPLSASADEFYKIFSEWLEQVIQGQFVLVGNSLGGALSLRFAQENPQRLSRLVLISPGGGFESEEEWESFKKGLHFRSIRDSAIWVDKIFHRKPFYIPLVYYPFMKSMRREGLLEFIEDTKIKDFDLSNVKHLPPTLFIWGKSEKLFPHHHLSRFRKILPGSVHFEEPEGVGHCPQLDNASWTWKRILKFVN